MLVPTTGDAGAAPALEQATFRAVRPPGWEVVGGFIWTFKVQDWRWRFGRPLTSRRSWNPGLWVGVPQQLCMNVEGQVSGPHIYSNSEGPFATHSSVPSLNWLCCFEINMNVPFRVSTSGGIISLFTQWNKSGLSVISHIGWAPFYLELQSLENKIKKKKTYLKSFSNTNLAHLQSRGVFHWKLRQKSQRLGLAQFFPTQIMRNKKVSLKNWLKKIQE